LGSRLFLFAHLILFAVLKWVAETVRAVWHFLRVLVQADDCCVGWEG
jgi:hypothetical protein